MAKIEIAKVAEVLKRSNLEVEVLKEIIQALQEEANAADDEKEEKPPAQKKQFVILVSDPDGAMPEGKEFVGWIVQIPEMASVLTVNERIHKASYDFNSSKRGRKNPVSTVGEACEAVASKHFKENDIAIKTKIPVAVVVTDNQIPSDEDDLGTKIDKRRKELD